MNQELVRCPLTGRENVRKVADLDIERIISDYRKLGIDVEDDLRAAGGIEIYACLETGYRFFSPQSLAGNAAFYEQLQQAYSGYYREDKWEYRRALRYLTSGESLLDVGCGSGAFVHLAKQAGLKAEGLEYNELAVQKGRSQRLTIHHEDLHQWAADHASQYDVVSSFQVLEHIADVRSFVQSNLKLLRPGGKLVIGVPNSNPYIFGFHLYDPLNLPPHHMGLWNARALEGLGQEFNLDPIKIEIQPMDEWKNWYLLKRESLRSTHPKLAKMMGWVPRPIYKSLVMCMSPFFEGRTVLAVFQKPAQEF
ncbi:MAG: class I SAM-dependent methyltransferase [Saprospiraceae bacterium]|nr:class I SAM-dependent methyltransferase [Saprospiraceae bacterium]